MHRVDDVHHAIGDFAVPFRPRLLGEDGIAEWEGRLRRE